LRGRDWFVYLVTGGAGFIGSHIVHRLVEDGKAVRVLDDFSSGKRENLATVDGVKLIEGDLRSETTVDEAVRGVEVIFHQGAVPSVPRSMIDPKTSFDVNVSGTLNLLLAAKDSGVRRVVMASSSSVYGDLPELPKVETMPTKPLSPYAASKLAGEELCQVFWRAYGLETVSLRYFNVFGPRQDPESQYAAVIPKFLKALKTGQRPMIFDDGEQTRDFTYIDNVVDANMLAADAEGISGDVFNIAAGDSISINEMLRQLAALVGVEPSPEYAPPRPGDIRDSRADIRSARAKLGYEVNVSFEEGLARTVAAFTN
jgi:nucleoside-diphosphate-sugar epimerase